MFYNELSAKYLFWTCQGIHFVFFRYFRNYLVAVSTCISHKWPTYIVSLLEIRTPWHASFCWNCRCLLYYIFWEFRNSYFQETVLKTIISVVVKSMKPACQAASFHKSCRPAVAMLYVLRSPVETAENSCGNNCWIQPTNKFNQNKFYRRCSIKGTKQWKNFEKVSLDSDCNET